MPGGKGQNRNRNNRGQFTNGDGGGGKKNKGKNNNNGGGKCGYFVDVGDWDKADLEQKLKYSQDALKWYSYFQEFLRKDDIVQLSDKARDYKISWEVVQVLVLLKEVCNRVDTYRAQAETEYNRLSGLVGTSVSQILTDQNQINVEREPSDVLKKLLIENNLRLGNTPVKSYLKVAGTACFEAAKSQAKIQNMPTPGDNPVKVAYDTTNLCFYVWYPVKGVTDPTYAVRFTPTKSGKYYDGVAPMDINSDQLVGPGVITIVDGVTSENELQLGTRGRGNTRTGRRFSHRATEGRGRGTSAR
jgi:hypothetical protein